MPVAPVYSEFIEEYPDLASLEQAEKEKLIDILSPLGLHEPRAEALLEIADRLSDSGVPAEKEALTELPWVGDYVADAVLCFQFGKQRTIVDANVIRIYSRLFGENGQELPQDEIQELADEILPPEKAREFNLALLDFGAEVCRGQGPLKPVCEECFAQEYCNYYQTKKKKGESDS